MSGFKVNFSVNNQLATPSIHAAALANRPAFGQPGRLFIDTDIPSSGIYRDTGTAWVQIAETSDPEADTLQTVTDRGNTTTQDITIGNGSTPSATLDVHSGNDVAEIIRSKGNHSSFIQFNRTSTGKFYIGNNHTGGGNDDFTIYNLQETADAFYINGSTNNIAVGGHTTTPIYQMDIAGSLRSGGDTFLGTSGGNVLGVGTTTVDNSAIVEIQSTSKGFLIPKMTAAQVEAISTPAAGLLVYSTTSTGTTVNQVGIWQYNSGSWQNTALKNDIRKQIWKYANTWEYFTDFVQPVDGWNGNNSGAGTYANDGNFQVGQDAFWNGVAFSTGSTSTGRSAGYYGFGQSGNLGVIKGNNNSITDFYCIGCYLPNLSTVAEEFVCKFGLGYVGNNATEKFIGFKYDRLNYGDFWVLELNDSGTFYTIVTNTPVVAATLYTFRVLITNWNNAIAGSGSSNIRGWINGTEVVATSGTYPIPTAPVYNGNSSGLGRFHPTQGIWKSAGTSARIIYIDGWYIYRNFITNRFTVIS